MKKLMKFINKMVDAIPIALTPIALIAIGWYLYTSFDVFDQWYALPAFALSTGILTLIIPLVTQRFKSLNTVISTGIVVLLILTVLPLVEGEHHQYLWGNLLLQMYAVALGTEWLSYTKIRVGDAIIDFAICALSAYFITLVYEYCLAVTVILAITYILIIKINFTFSFSIRKNQKKTTK